MPDAPGPDGLSVEVAADPIADLGSFAERLLAVIDEGRRTATYKLAVLLALIDCCAQASRSDGSAPSQIPTRAIAREVARLYWPQLRPYPCAGEAIDLVQITNKSATIIATLRSAFLSLPNVTTWDVAEERLPATAVRQVLDVVELTVAKYPLVRLQTLDGVAQPFIYQIDWGESVTIPRLTAGGGAVVRLYPGAGDQLIRLAPLIRPLIELHWVRMVASLNKLAVTEDDLRKHLFGTERITFPTVLRKGLLDLQDGTCFYCDSPLTSASAVDHFVPWSRWPNDAVENLVIAHGSCNSHKSDRIPGPTPLNRWATRLSERSHDLATIADAAKWRTDRARTVSLARSLYAHLPRGALVWNSPKHVTIADRVKLMGMLNPL